MLRGPHTGFAIEMARWWGFHRHWAGIWNQGCSLQTEKDNQLKLTMQGQITQRPGSYELKVNGRVGGSLSSCINKRQNVAPGPLSAYTIFVALFTLRLAPNTLTKPTTTMMHLKWYFTTGRSTLNLLSLWTRHYPARDWEVCSSIERLS